MLNKDCGTDRKLWPKHFGWYEVLETHTYCNKRHIKKWHIYPVTSDWFGWKYSQLPEFSEDANETVASIRWRYPFLRFFKEGFAKWIYICDLSISHFPVKYIFHNRLTECHFVQPGGLCPNSKCWRSTRVWQATRNGWTTWRAVWGQNGYIPVRKGPQQDWRISTGFKCRRCWGFWWLGIQVQTERTRHMENMFHTA